MVKITANMSKKIPVEGMDYSSQSFSAGIDVEVLDLPAVPAKLHEVYAILDKTIEAEIAARQGKAAGNPKPEAAGGKPAPEPEARQAAVNSGDNRQRERRYGNAAPRNATDAQLTAIAAIAHAAGINERDLSGMLEERYGVRRADQLSVREASLFIDYLKNQKQPVRRAA